METKIRTLTSSALTALILVSLLTSCGTDKTLNSDTADTTDGTAETATSSEELTDGIGEKDFNGREFGIVTCKDFFFSPYDPESENGELLNDAAYKRNRDTEDRFNCKIVYTMLSGSAGEASDAIRQSVMAGDNSYQLGIVHPFIGLKGLITDSLVLDWNKVDIVDFSKPWWNSTFNETLAIRDILPCASSDFIYFNSGCVYFNKEIAGKYEIDPYSLVYDGKWTWDRLSEIAKSAYADLNGSGSADDGDQFGYSIINNHRMIPVTYSYGISPSSKDSESYITIENIGSEKMHSIVQNYYSLIYENEGSLLLKSDELVPFRSGQVLFLHYVTQNIQALRDLEWDFGILPMPKYTEDQEKYYSLAQSNVMVIPATETDTEFVGTLTEALSAYSYFNVMPALYDTTFNNKYLRDEDSVAMFDIIKNSLVYDPLWNYNTSKDTCYFLSSLISKKSADTASFYAANHESAEAELRKFYDEAIEAYADKN